MSSVAPVVVCVCVCRGICTYMYMYMYELSCFEVHALCLQSLDILVSFESSFRKQSFAPSFSFLAYSIPELKPQPL